MKPKIFEFYNKLQKNRKGILIQSIFFIFFLLGVNIFAWFTFVSKAETSIDGSVASWDVEFNANGVTTSKVNVSITNMKPGMLDFKHDVLIHNLGEVKASFNYELISLNFMGQDINIGDGVETLNKFEDFYPFIIKLGSSKGLLSSGDYSTFSVNANWSYEDNEFYKLDSLYMYDSSYNYYRLVNNNYVIDNTIDSSNYLANRDNLYLEKDDADTYFGEKCGLYEKNSGLPCIRIGIKLIVNQIKESDG